MEITGWDTVIFTFTPPREVFARVIASVLSHWPGALVDGLGPPASPPEPVAGLSVEKFPTGSLPHPIFYRDGTMAQHMEDHAYVPMADGDGPFAVITRERRDVVFELAGLRELSAADHTPVGPRPPDPYRAWLCSPQVIEVAAVTPADPSSHPFSAWVLDQVKQACRS